MKIIIEEAENGFIVEEDPEITISGNRQIGKKHVFADIDVMQDFVTAFYTKKGKTPRKKKVDAIAAERERIAAKMEAKAAALDVENEGVRTTSAEALREQAAELRGETP